MDTPAKLQTRGAGGIRCRTGRAPLPDGICQGRVCAFLVHFTGESTSERILHVLETVEERHRQLVTSTRKSAAHRKDAGSTERECGGGLDGRTGVYVHW